MLQLKKSFLPIRIHIIGNRRPAQSDGFFKHFLNRKKQPSQIFLGERRSPPPRPNACPVQRFIRINIADATQQLLVQQCALDRSLPSSEQTYEALQFDFERLRTRSLKSVGDAQTSKTSRIHEPEFPARPQPRN